MAPSPAKILSQFGPVLGNAILNKDISAVSTATLYPGKWAIRINAILYCIPVNGIIVPVTFDVQELTHQWLRSQLPAIGLLQPECVDWEDGSRIAYRAFSPVDQDHIIAEAILITNSNLVKKIRQLHPEWLFITDDGFKPYSVINAKYVFYWTAHSSHTLMENIFKKLAPDAEIMYVTATNLELLEKQMRERYADIETRKRRGGSEEVSG